ncbi:ankyrin [Aspergillus eucalypticola CBS 122712]|uniref:Ankyrin n=1 Tax=Aspergillus eucalypticola (strain CBS 122712 / IBT 29274) TaxID=1448314 RepID=A0A317W094_ASPEC|nr:ankyrin [Aspergillus eucalypticola CBS 122712]PWY77560.1 ankyrin [Aspergillus eucalypticola CBS 122712]
MDALPLLHAALTGHNNIVKSLLSTGIPDPNCRDAGGKTPLAQVSYHGHDEIVGLLLANDEVDPDMQDNHGKTSLALACQGGHESIVALLLKTGKVNPNSEDHYGTKPLTHAMEFGNEGIIKLISDAINSRDSESSPNTSSRSSLQLDAASEFQPAIDASMNKVCSSIWHARWRGKTDPHSIGGTIWARSKWIRLADDIDTLAEVIICGELLTHLH